MDKKGIALLAIALVLAIAAGGGVYTYLKGMPAAQARGPETTPVIVAAKDMTFGTTLTEEQVRVVKFPKDAVPAGSFSNVDSVLSQTTKVFVVAGEPILASKLSAIGGGLSVRVPPHMRAMSVKINEVSGVSGFVLPGDRIDILVTVDNAAGSNIAVTKTILQNVEVLAAGVKTETKNNHNITVQTVTVLVDPQGAEALALGLHQGKIHLSLRNPVDQELADATSTNTRQVLGLNTPKRATRRSSSRPQIQATTKAPVPVESNSFTIIKDGKISKQESPTGDSEDNSNKK